jgi:hypothetical protein
MKFIAPRLQIRWRVLVEIFKREQTSFEDNKRSPSGATPLEFSFGSGIYV